MYICIYVYMYICMHVYMYMYIYILYLIASRIFSYLFAFICPLNRGWTKHLKQDKENPLKRTKSQVAAKLKARDGSCTDGVGLTFVEYVARFVGWAQET